MTRIINIIDIIMNKHPPKSWKYDKSGGGGVNVSGPKKKDAPMSTRLGFKRKVPENKA